jgi:predicted 2-oxoglutarate/Fe(II)-dependent dioxygenase YbiX
LPYGLILKKKFLSDDVADKLVGYAEKQSTASDLAIFTESDEGAQESLSTVVNSDRVTSRIELGDKQSIIDKWIADVFYKLLAKHVGKKIRSFTTPDLMRYTKGGYYKAHSDADIFDSKTGIWKKVLDRDYSLLLYLNNDFEGGAVRFEHFNYTYHPEKGDLLIFPSDYLYLHEALLVTAGVRYVIVSWASVK